MGILSCLETLEKFIQLISSIRDRGPDILNNFTESFLPSLYKASPQLYHQTVGPIFQNALMRVHGSQNEELQKAAKLVSKALFGNDAIATGQSRLPGVQKKNLPVVDPSVSRGRESLDKEYYDRAWKEVDQDGSEATLSYIGKVLTSNGLKDDYQSKALATQMRSDITAELSKDAAYSATMKTAWGKVLKDRLSPSTKREMVNAHLKAVRRVLPKFLKGVVQPREAKGGRQDPPSNSRSRQSSPSGDKQIDWTKTTAFDFLNDEPTYIQ